MGDGCSQGLDFSCRGRRRRSSYSSELMRPSEVALVPPIVPLYTSISNLTITAINTATSSDGPADCLSCVYWSAGCANPFPMVSSSMIAREVIHEEQHKGQSQRQVSR